MNRKIRRVRFERPAIDGKPSNTVHVRTSARSRHARLAPRLSCWVCFCSRLGRRCALCVRAQISDDFASQIEFTKLYTKTCAYPAKCNNFVAVVGTNHRRIEVPASMSREGVTHKLVADNHHFHVMSTANSDATYVHEARLLIHELLVTGRLGARWASSGVEVFRDGKRLLGSSTSEPLKHDLVDATEPMAYVSAPITAFLGERDGCSEQYQVRPRGGACALSLLA